MRKTAGVILAFCILLNSGIAAFSAVIPDVCLIPAVKSGNSQMAKLFSSVFNPLSAVNLQVCNDNPLVPKLNPFPSPSSSRDNCSSKNIITSTDNSASSIMRDRGTVQKASVPGIDPACFVIPQVFPPPGFIKCVNCLFLQYLVFLAKSNLPWEIGFAIRV